MEKLPLLHYQTERFGDNVFQNSIILSVFHLLGDSTYFFEALTKMGVCNKDIYIIGIPYSNRKESVEQLREETRCVYS
ncbi:MAG: hypothetical protein AYK19_15135 [Theionarchaea archaeon DG-70-1]|nr:MAG: hypothetical protein AYK19_15135 [Theionarchaea archaeon DG-70-1]